MKGLNQIRTNVAAWSWLMVFILALAGVELAVRTPTFWDVGPGKLTVEERIIKPAMERSPHPKVVFMGNSRFRLGVSPRVIGEIVGLPPMEVSNIAVDGGTPQDILGIYQEFRSTLQTAELLVIQAEAKMFRSTNPPGDGRAFSREDASLSARLRAPSWPDRIDLTLGWVWKTWELRSRLYRYLKTSVKSVVLYRGGADFDDLHRVVWSRQPATHPTAADSRNRQDLVDFLLDEEELQAFQELVTLAREDGMVVVLVEPPMGPAFRSMVAERFAEEDAEWRSRVKEATGLEVVPEFPDGVSCSDWRECFVDDGHVNYAGAEGYSQAMGDWLLREFPELTNAGSHNTGS